MNLPARGRWPLALAMTGVLAWPVGAQTSLSIYKDGRVVVRQSVAQALARGRSALTLKLEGLDLATLFSPDTLVSLASATVRYPSTEAEALARAGGQTVAFARERGDTVRATVIRADPPQYRLADGRVLLHQPGRPLFPADLVRSTPEARLVLEAARERPRTELAYVTQGAAWETLYQVVLGGGGRAAVSGTATVTSSAVAAESAEVQLVAGAVRRARVPPPAAQRQMRLEAITIAAPDSIAGPTEAAVGETHVYLLPGKLTLERGVPVATALFPRAASSYTQELVVPGVLPWRGWIGQEPGEPSRVSVQVWYTLKRGRGSPFGDRPLPAGTVQVYQADSAGRLQLVGESAIPHTAPGRDLRLHTGDAFDVTTERVQTDYSQEQLAPLRRGMPARQRLTASYRVTIANAKAEAVTVDVRETRTGVWRIVESSVPPEKLSATEVRFRVPVPAGGEATLTYTVQIET